MFHIDGGRPLRGSVRVEGSKNAALPIMAAALAVDGTVRLARIPELVDVQTMTLLLQSLGADVRSAEQGQITIQMAPDTTALASYELVRRMRAGVCVLGPLLARFGQACVSLPGGCNIGHRPIDLHLKGLTALGAEIRLKGGYVFARAPRLRGAEINLNGPFGSTVTGTCNVMTAAALARGRTVIHAAACEPEVCDVGRFLNAAGARITGLGSRVIEIDGVENLHSVQHTVIPDRIEAATLAIAAAITKGDILIEDAPIGDLSSVTETLRSIGVTVEQELPQNTLCSQSERSPEPNLRVSVSQALRPVRLVAEPFPGVPTDTQAQLMALLTLVDGTSRIRDAVFPDRLMHASELIRMGADIQIDSGTAVIRGVPRLTGAAVMASDLRASAALVLAALAASGQSEIRRVYHLDRGYATLERRLNALGARIVRCPEPGSLQVVPPPHIAIQRTHHAPP